MQLYIKKLVSLSPDRYDFIPYEEAFKKYDDWINFLIDNTYYVWATKSVQERFFNNYKSFDQWSETEI